MQIVANPAKLSHVAPLELGIVLAVYPINMPRRWRSDPDLPVGAQASAK